MTPPGLPRRLRPVPPPTTDSPVRSARALAAEQNAEARKRHAAAAAEQNGAGREQFHAAAAEQRLERALAGGAVPVPERITAALNLRGLYGPKVDIDAGTFEGNPDGDVDMWEDVDDPRLPNEEQVRLLAELTDFPRAFFYEPWSALPMRGWMCFAGRGGCEQIDDDGRPVPPAREAGQGVLFAPPDPADPPPRPAPTRAARPKKTPPPVVQPTLPNRMPDHLRGPLVAKLAARKNGHDQH